MTSDPQATDDFHDMWWYVLRPDRLGVAQQMDKAAARYRRSELHQAADALEDFADRLRAAAGEVRDDREPPEPDVDAYRAILAKLSAGDAS